MIGRLGVLLAVVAAALVAASPAAAAPQVNGEFPVSGLGTYNALTTGPDGNIWVTLDAGNDVAKITPAGNVQQFNPTDLNNPVGITRLGNNLWVTQTGGVARFSPGDPNGAVATPIAGIGTANDIVVGSDGNLWTASATTVFRIPPGTPGSASPFTVLTSARGVAAGGDGNIWVADSAGGQIVSVRTNGTPAPGSPYSTGITTGPQDVTAGPGTQMAFTDPLSGPPHRLGRITPGGTPQFTPIGTSDPFGVALGPDGAYWTARFSTNNLGRLTTNGQFTQLGGFSANAGPRQLARGPNNTLWVTLETANKVARVTGFDSPQPPPSNEFTIEDVKKNKKKGTAKLELLVAGPGELSLEGKKVKPVDETVEAVAAGLEDGINATLKVKAKGKAKKKLKKKGKAKVKMDVTYTPTGGEPNTQDTALTLKKKK